MPSRARLFRTGNRFGQRNYWSAPSSRCHSECSSEFDPGGHAMGRGAMPFSGQRSSSLARRHSASGMVLDGQNQLEDNPRGRFRRTGLPKDVSGQGTDTPAGFTTKATKRRFPNLRPGRRRNGKLSDRDPINPSRAGRFADIYTFKGIRADQQVRVKVLSRVFDPYIQVVNQETGAVIIQNDDNGSNLNSRLSFVVQPDITYQLRVSSYAPKETGEYTLSVRALTPAIQDFSFAYGYGLIDAQVAVDGAIALAAASPAPNSAGDILLDPQPDADQWNLDQINAPLAWEQGHRGNGVVVAVVDTGVSLHHPDIVPNLWQNPGEIPDNGIDDDGNGFVDDSVGWDFVQNDSRPRDASYHGTHVAGIVAAPQNDIGVTGVAPDAAIMPVRVLDRNGAGTAKGVADGIRYAVDNGADVINLSLGAPPGRKPSRSLRRALRYAYRNGVVVAIAAGNERDALGTAQPGEPAFWAATRNLAIAVGAVNRNNHVADFSNPTGNRRVNPFVVAPGVDVNSLAALWLRNAFGPNNGDSIEPLALSGTSMATPHVSGVAALMLSANPMLTVDQVIQILTSTANPENLKAV